MNRGRNQAGRDAHYFAKVGKGSAVLAGWWRFTWRWESRGTTLGQTSGFRAFGAGGDSLNVAELEAWAAKPATGDTMTAHAGCRGDARR